MGDCPRDFGQTAFVQPSGNVIGNDVYIPGLNLDLIFDRPMDVGFLPALASMQIIVDGIPETPTIRSWLDSTHFRLSFAGTPSVSGEFRLLVEDTGLRTTLGSVTKPPQRWVFFP
jgi:hypothetical protein